MIMAQLGGNRFIAMTGAKNFLSHEDGALSFRLPGRKINFMKITLKGKDLYDVEFGKVTAGKTFTYKVVSSVPDVFCEDLQAIFTETTGLYTKLF